MILLVFLVDTTFISQNMVFNEREVALPRRCDDVGLSNDARSCGSLRNVSCGKTGGGVRGKMKEP